MVHQPQDQHDGDAALGTRLDRRGTATFDDDDALDDATEAIAKVGKAAL